MIIIVKGLKGLTFGKHITLDELSLLGHEMVHVIQFRDKPILKILRIIFERLYYGKKAYTTKGTLEYEAQSVQLCILHN